MEKKFQYGSSDFIMNGGDFMINVQYILLAVKI